MNNDHVADATRNALIADHNARMVGGPKVALPNGLRVSADPYIGAKYPGENSTTLLGAPQEVLKNPTPGSMYVWKVRTDAKTAALVRAQHLRPVEMHEIDPTCALAEIVELVTPSGTFIMWETMALFEMPAQCIERYYTGYEKYAIGRLAQQAVDFSERVVEESRGSHKGKMSIKA